GGDGGGHSAVFDAEEFRPLSVACRAAAASNALQQDHRDLAAGLLLVLGEPRHELLLRLPDRLALLVLEDPGPGVDRFGAALHLATRSGPEVVIPVRVRRSAALIVSTIVSIPSSALDRA